MEIFIALAVSWIISYALIAHGDKTGNDAFNKAGMAVFFLGIVIMLVMAGPGTGLDEPNWRYDG